MANIAKNDFGVIIGTCVVNVGTAIRMQDIDREISENVKGRRSNENNSLSELKIIVVY